MIEERQLLVKLKRDSLFSQFNGKCILINVITQAITQRVIDILTCTENRINQIFMMQHIIFLFGELNAYFVLSFRRYSKRQGKNTKNP